MTRPIYKRRSHPAGHPVELRFVDMLLIIIATLMLVAVLLSVTSAFSASSNTGQPDLSPVVTTVSAPTAIAKEPYDLALSARGGDGTYTWKLLHGHLPNGMRLNRGGTVQGTPGLSQRGIQATVQVTDGEGITAQRDLMFNVRPSGTGNLTAPPPQIAAPVTLLEGAVTGQDYQHVFEANSGVPPYRWRISGVPPRGLQLAPDGTLAGQPAQAGSATFNVTMTDSSGATARQTVRIIVANAPTSIFWRILGWLKTAMTYFGYLVAAILVRLWIFGSPPQPERPGTPPIWIRILGRKS